MENLFFFLFRTFIDFVSIVLVLRLIAARFISTSNPIHQFIILFTNPIIRPFSSRFLKQSSFEIILISLVLLIELFGLWFMMTFQCLTGPSFLQLIGLSLMNVIILVLRIFLFSILAHVILSWFNPNYYSPAIRFIGELVSPILKPIQKRMPYLSGLDLSPLISIVIIQSIIMIIPVDSALTGIVCSNLSKII